MIGILLSGDDEQALDDMAATIREALFAKGLTGEVHYAHLATKPEWDKLKKMFHDRGDHFFISKRTPKRGTDAIA